MPRLRENKKNIRQWLQDDKWREHIQDISAMDPREATGPLLSMLLLGDHMTHRAAHVLGLALAKLAEQKMEDARNILRRFMWHMNEESGNIGWGIPEAFAQSMIHSERLAKEFSPILLSYIMDTGRDDNFCDHAVLRRSCFFAVGSFIAARPQLCTKVIPWLVRGFQDEDFACRGLAAYALQQFPKEMIPSLEVYPMLRRLSDSPRDVLETPCSVFDGDFVQSFTVEELVQKALRHF